MLLLTLAACFLVTDADHLARIDADGDGAVAATYGGDDCDDADATIHPGATDGCDGVDQDCDGELDEDGDARSAFYADNDADGYGDPTVTLDACSAPEGFVGDDRDCDDHDGDVYPNADESCDADEDLNCDGQFGPVDHDGDGFAACEECDDGDAGVNPDAIEVCNDKDDDCEGSVDQGATDATTWYADGDADGYGADEAGTVACDPPAATVATTGDCDDADAATNPGIDETCTDTEDHNCDGAVGGEDGDGDGVRACDDCDDDAIAVFPGAEERCDGVDNDCDGDVDNTAVDRFTWYADSDGDGYGDVTNTTPACERPADFLTDATDCDDADSAVNPGAVELCDGVDNDCSGDIDGDAGDRATWYADADGDGFGDPATSALSCDQPAGHVVDAADCDDTDYAVNPDGIELCDSVDNDCSGDADSDAVDRSTWYADTDGDGFGDAASTTSSCDAPEGFVPGATDCDDGDADTFPGSAPNESATACETDADGDDYGDTTPPSGGTAGADCDDANATVSPAATETCNLTDDDCDGAVDDVLTLYYTDSDGDAFGDASTATCTSGGGRVTVSGDCDDADGAAFPGADEYCDAVDNDCDGVTDEDDAVDASIWYADADGDGYGDAASRDVACDVPAGYVADDSDCDDDDGAVNPAATEVCENGVDDDCDGGFSGCLGSGSLSTADARYTGEAADDLAGYSVSGVGDVNGDGLGDIVVGAFHNDNGGADAGAAYLVLGSASPSGVSLGVADAQFTGETAFDCAGYSVAAAGDVDGDGLGDILVGAIFNRSAATSERAGAAYLILGRASPGDLSLSAAEAEYGGRGADDQVGRSVSSAGDFNADGFADIVVGAPYNDDGATEAGAVFLVLGSPSPGDVDLVLADAQFSGEAATDDAGVSVASAGDVDGDGFSDLVIGAWQADGGGAQAGAAYLILGTATPAGLGLGSADARYDGAAAGDYAGCSVSGAGDVNADGLDDLIIGAYVNDDGGTSAGAAYLVLGSATPGDRSLAGADAVYLGEAAGDLAGASVAAGGDVDADGFADLLIGAEYNSEGGSHAGAAYVVLGNVAPSSLGLADADARFTGEAAIDQAGSRIAGTGDVDGDGFDDFLIGSAKADTAGTDAGAAYLILGSGL